ncbi:hypothetical protein CDL12_30381 [Handroanthus impetiginosus]|uniref:Uncharacterized protein n=1 Tax=Handroanthus impetiginosus TaxID=429701 RepID=A0A2G9FW43_9LAMI|nr:hypothetical protein CDL12_30381 [Handroanthus impetiginosus]
MASSSFPDLFSWIENLPPIPQWQTNSISLTLCPSSTSQACLKLSIKCFNNYSFSLSIFADYNLPFFLWTSKTIPVKPTSNKLLHDSDTISSLLINLIDDVIKISLTLCPSSTSQACLKLSIKCFNNYSFSLSIFADYNLPVFLWTSKTIPVLKPTSNKLLHDSDTISSLLINLIDDVIKYSPNRCPYSLKLPKNLQNNHHLKDIFNFSFLSLTFIVCIYEAPSDLRSSCLNTLKDQLACTKSRKVSKILMRLLGSNTEEQCMRSINLAITNWISEIQAANLHIKTPSPLFSYSFSTHGLWKVQLYCPVIAMNVEKASGSGLDDRLLFSLNYHQVEGVIQLNYKVVVKEKWIEVMVNTDNIRCDVIKLLTDTLMTERGAGPSEKHFPSRISLHITPTLQSNIISISVSKSSENPPREISVEKGIEASFEPPTSVGFNLLAGETSTISMKPWVFEQSVYGNSAILDWFLHDSMDGREVFSSKPSKMALLHHKAWFKNRYSNAYRPFTRQGGVVFAGDEYGERVCWKVDRACVGRSMEWEIKGWIWLTYWPNKYKSFYSETKRLEFREVLDLSLV